MRLVIYFGESRDLCAKDWGDGMGSLGSLDGLVAGWDVSSWVVLLWAGAAGWLRVCRRPAAETSGVAPAKAGGGNRAPQTASQPSPI